MAERQHPQDTVPVANLYPDPPLADRWLNVPAHLNVMERLGLRDMAALCPPGGKIVDVGAWLGGSLACLLAGSRAAAATVYSFDFYSDHALERQKAVLAAYDVSDDRVVRIAGNTSETGPEWARIGHKTHMVFMDGSKTPSEVRSDLVYLGGTVVKGGFLAIHDSRYPPEAEFSDRIHRLHSALHFAGIFDPLIAQWFDRERWVETKPYHTMRVFKRL